MELAASAMPERHPNRPFVQYNAARGNAMMGRAPEAAEWLGRMLYENIEGLMVWYSGLDPAFNRIRAGADYRDVIERSENLTLKVTPIAGSLFCWKGRGAIQCCRPAGTARCWWTRDTSREGGRSPAP
jgi:hypothetical protein